MIAEGPIVKGWAASTAPKIVQLIDEFIINYPQANVRKTTTKLLASLFKKGTQEQRANIMTLLIERMQQLNSMGKSSEEFLSLISKIFEMFPQGFLNEKMQIFNEVLLKAQQIFAKVISNKEYKFYSLCANMIDFGEEFKPYLLEANGCLKCFGRPDIEFEHMNINNIREELKVHINNIQWVLKRKYEMNNLQINFIKKKLNFKSMTIYYLDDHGVRNELGKFTPNDVLPPFNITTSTIGITFEFSKARRTHIACLMCSSNEQYAVLCSNCVGKLIDIEGSVKVVAGNPSKINKELIDSFRVMNQLRGQLQTFASSVASESKISHLKINIVSEMQMFYTNIIQNLRLLRNLNEVELKQEKDKYSQYSTDCYSCHFFELSSCINFISEILNNPNFKIEFGKLHELVVDFKEMFFKNKVHSINGLLSSILAELFNRVASIDYFKQIEINSHNGKLIVKLMANFIQHIKSQHKENNNLLVQLKKFIFDKKINQFFSLHQKIELFVMLTLNEEYYELLNDQKLEVDKLQDIKRLTQAEYAEYQKMLDFAAGEVLNYNINNYIKLYLVLIPEECVPVSNLNIVDAEYLKFINNKPPVISDELILSNIVFAPNPIIKLNLFKLLPQMIQNLPLEQSIELIRQLCKYKPLWNTYIRETVDTFNKMLDSVQKQRKLMLCLEGYNNSKEDLYFQHIYKILTPQRTNFIIRLEIPEKEMQKEQKNKGGPVEYIYLPVREVKSDELKSDTIGALHEWITQQIRRMGQDMPFDLIVQGNIIDQLDLSLQIIYKKIVQKQVKRQIGNKTYDFFKVIYRIQGIFGEANQRNCGHPRDQKLEQCTNFTYHLLNKLPNRKTGLDVLMEVIPALDSNTVQIKEKKEKVIKILGIIFKNETIIQRIVEWDHSNAILNLAIKSISLNKKEIKETQTLLEMCSKIIDQANLEMVKIRKNSGVYGSRKPSQADMDIEVDSEESLKSVKYVLEKVKQAEQSGFRQMSKKLIKMLPFCSRDDLSASRYLYEFFEVNKILQIKYLSKLPWLLEFINALSESYTSFKHICSEEGITGKMVELIAFGLSIQDTEKVKENIENIQTSLALCKGLIQGDMQFQEQLFEKQILQSIYKVSEEKKIKMGKIPQLCYDIIKYFQEGKMISPQVHEFFVSNEKKKKESIQQQKSKKMQSVLDRKKKALETYKNLLSQNSEVISCSSCKEGYGSKKEVLGVYVYSTKIEILSLEGWWKQNKKVQAITSTSYFEPIHLQCHIDAMKDDMKIQKSQWDGALIRNSQVLCNNWCPLKGPETTDQDFDKALKKYFEKNNKALSFWVVINDLNGLLERFSKEYNFAHETKGSSPTHNAKLIPLLMANACHILRNTEDIKYIKEGMAHIQDHLTKKPNLIHLYFCLLLFTCGKTGLNNKKSFCLKLIDNLGYGNFKDSKPFYIELALIQSTMRITHSAVDPSNLTNSLGQYICKNLLNILQSFEGLAEAYKNVYTHWEKIEDVKAYFQQR